MYMYRPTYILHFDHAASQFIPLRIIAIKSSETRAVISSADILVKALPRVLYGKYSMKKSGRETNIAQGMLKNSKPRVIFVSCPRYIFRTTLTAVLYN